MERASRQELKKKRADKAAKAAKKAAKRKGRKKALPTASEAQAELQKLIDSGALPLEKLEAMLGEKK